VRFIFHRETAAEHPAMMHLHLHASPKMSVHSLAVDKKFRQLENILATP